MQAELRQHCMGRADGTMRMRFWNEARVSENRTQALRFLSGIKPSAARHSFQSPVASFHRHGWSEAAPHSTLALPGLVLF